MNAEAEQIGGEGPEELGVASASQPPLSHPSGAEPVPVSGKAGIANAFAPGPWAFGAYDLTFGQEISCTIGSVSFPVCFAHTPLQGGVARHDMREANARLIAAAPDLLQAAMACWALLQADENYEGSECKEMARAAIAKAVGQ